MEKEADLVEEVVSIEDVLRGALQQAYDKGYQAGVKAAGLQIRNTLNSINGPTPPPAYRIPVNELGLSERARLCLIRGDLNTIGDVVEFHNSNLDAGGLLILPNFGNKSFEEVYNSLDEHGVVIKEP